MSYRRIQKEQKKELLYTVWSLVVVRNRLPAQVVKRVNDPCRFPRKLKVSPNIHVGTSFHEVQLSPQCEYKRLSNRRLERGVENRVCARGIKKWKDNNEQNREQ